MTAGLQTYASMKASGVSWLGKVPAHWNVMRTKWILSRNDSGVWGSDFDDNGVIVLRSTEQTVSGEWKITAPAKRRLTESEYLYSRLEEGDLLVTTSSGSSLHIGKTTIVTKDVAVLDCCFSNFMQRLRVKNDILPRFVWYCLNREMGRTQLDYLSDTTTGLANLNGKIIGIVEFAFPTLSEQAAIVRFLDHVDRRIRRYIRAKEKLIALLEEQKQAIIHHAVTGQIDVRTGRPYREYKPSGVEWLGDVPVQWQILRFGRVISLTVGFPFKSDSFTQSKRDMRLLRGINVAPGRLRWDEVVRWSATDLDTYSDYQIEVGDIILGMDRPIIGSGIRVAMAYEKDVPSLLLQRVARIRPTKGKLDRNFALRILSSRNFLNYLAPIFTGISVPHLSPDQIREFGIALPSVTEQRAIVEYLTSRVSDFQFEVERTERQIDLLREYRTRPGCRCCDRQAGRARGGGRATRGRSSRG